MVRLGAINIRIVVVVGGSWEENLVSLMPQALPQEDGGGSSKTQISQSDKQPMLEVALSELINVANDFQIRR